jgi:hypothetical protein
MGEAAAGEGHPFPIGFAKPVSDTHDMTHRHRHTGAPRIGK